MSELKEEIEAAARAIWMVGQDWNDPSVFEDMPDYGQDVWRDRARAALSASGLPAALERVKAAEDRLFDMLLQDDGQAYKEAERYLQQYRPDLAEIIRLAQ